MTITDQDMCHQVRTALSGDGADFDVKGIVAEIIGRSGLCDIDTLQTGYFWSVAQRYDMSGWRMHHAPDSVTPAPGPVWTNGVAPAASLPTGWCGNNEPHAPHDWPLSEPAGPARRCQAEPHALQHYTLQHCTPSEAGPAPIGHPTWCDRQHPRATAQFNTQITTHTLELLSMVVQDETTIEDVPLRVALERTDTDGEAGATNILLSIGHMLYQPTGIVLDDASAARVLAALLTARQLKALG